LPTGLGFTIAVAILIFAAACEEPAAPDVEPEGEEATETEAAQPLSVATLMQTRGDVRAQSAASATWTKAGPGLPLAPNDSVQTMEESQAMVVFEETGAVARLGPMTTLRIPAQAPDSSRLRHISGTLTARVEEGGRQVEVELPPGTLRLDPPADSGEEPVEAQLQVTEESTEIIMVRGGGQLAPRQGEAIRVRQSHFLIVDNEGTVQESGRTGEQVELVAPADGATVRTRSGVRFEWSPTAAEAYLLEVTPESGADSQQIRAEGAGVVVDLPSGSYRWQVRGVIEGDPLPGGEPRLLSVVQDRVPPRLSVESPRASAVVRGPSVQVVGHTEPGATVRVDGSRIRVGADGRFRHAHALPRGLANVVIVATDDLGNARTIARAVRRE